MRGAQEGRKRRFCRRFHPSDAKVCGCAIVTALPFLGIDEIAVAAPDLHYPLPSRDILRASSACCEQGGGNEENDFCPLRWHGAAPKHGLDVDIARGSGS